MYPCRCVMMWMSAWEYAMMRMFPYGYVMMQMPFCRYALMQMFPYGYAMMKMSLCAYVMMQMSHWCMSWCECSLGSMPWCKCLLESMPWCECPLVGMSWCECFDANTIFFKNFLYFQNEAFSTPEIKIFSKLDLLFLKSHLLFDLRLPRKNWWSLLEIFEWGIDSESDDLAQKIYFHNLVGQRGGTFPRLFVGKKTNSLKIKHLKKIHFF